MKGQMPVAFYTRQIFFSVYYAALVVVAGLWYSQAKVTDESLGARKNAKNAKEHLLNYWTGIEIRQSDIRNRAC